MVAQAHFIFLLVASTASASFLDDLGWSWPPNLPNLMELAPIPSLPNLSVLMPSLFAPASGLNLDVLENNNQSARLNCSWVGAGAETANLTLLVDGEEQTGEEGVKKEEGKGGIVLTLDWSTRNLTVGQAVVVSCNGQAGKEGWASVSSVSELVPVGGLLPEKPEEGNKTVESPELSSISQIMQSFMLAEQPEGQKPLEQLELPEGKQQP